MKGELDRTLPAFLALRPLAAFFDVFSGAVVWTDEIPGESQFDCLGFLRHIHHVRMKAARERQPPRDLLWDYFRQRVPSWPGFLPERCDSDRLLELETRLRPLHGKRKT
jgi:hypothetical protein